VPLFEVKKSDFPDRQSLFGSEPFWGGFDAYETLFKAEKDDIGFGNTYPWNNHEE